MFIRSVKGISTLAIVLMLIISFLLGAVLSYIFTLGFYAPNEYVLPSQKTLTIERIEFHSSNATFFDVTVLNPSYSPSNITIQSFQVETSDGKIHSTFTPGLPLSLAVGASKSLQSFWNWGNYTGQAVQVLALVSNGVGSNMQVAAPPMNFSITSINFNPSFTADNFTVTIQDSGSPVPVNITKILVNGFEYPTEPSLTVAPYALANSSTAPSVTFVLKTPWAQMQGQGITVTAQTMQGYTAYKSSTAPRVFLNITDANFNTSNTGAFTATVYNLPTSAADLTISQVTVTVGNATEPTVIQNWFATRSGVNTTTLQRSSIPTIVSCVWNWSGYRGQNVTITISTVQDFNVARRFQIPA